MSVTSCAPVAVDEWVNGLELRVRDGCLGDRWQRVVVREADEVADEVRNMLGRRRYEVRVAWVVVAATNPVLLSAEPPAVLLEPGPPQKTSMDFKKQFHSDHVSGVNLVDAVDHRVDVPEYLNSRDIGWALAKSPGGFSSQEAAGADCKPSIRDEATTCPQQHSGEGLGVHEACRLEIQAGDRCLGVGNVGRDFAIEAEGATHEPVGHVGFVVAPAVVLPRRARLIADPVATENRRQDSSLFTFILQP